MRSLTRAELDDLAGRLESAILTGAAPTTGDPFAAGISVVVEESGRGLDRLGAGLARVLSATAAPSWFALRYEVDDGRIRWADGFALTVDPAGAGFDAAGQEIGFLINGLDFVLTDATARWAVMTTVDVLLLGGPRALVRAYHGDDAAVADARARFDELLATPGMRAEYTRMRTFQRD